MRRIDGRGVAGPTSRLRSSTSRALTGGQPGGAIVTRHVVSILVRDLDLVEMRPSSCNPRPRVSSPVSAAVAETVSGAYGRVSRPACRRFPRVLWAETAIGGTSRPGPGLGDSDRGVRVSACGKPVSMLSTRSSNEADTPVHGRADTGDGAGPLEVGWWTDVVAVVVEDTIAGHGPSSCISRAPIGWWTRGGTSAGSTRIVPHARPCPH